MAHGDAREGKWRGNWRMGWVASTLHNTSELGVSSITTAYAHTSAASSRLNWRPCRFKWTRPFPRKTKCGFCACAITFQTHSTSIVSARLKFTVLMHESYFDKSNSKHNKSTAKVNANENETSTLCASHNHKNATTFT